jgi:hypothetical protein
MVWAFDEALGLAEYDYDVKVLVIKSNANGLICSPAGESGGAPSDGASDG